MGWVNEGVLKTFKSFFRVAYAAIPTNLKVAVDQALLEYRTPTDPGDIKFFNGYDFHSAFKSKCREMHSWWFSLSRKTRAQLAYRGALPDVIGSLNSLKLNSNTYGKRVVLSTATAAGLASALSAATPSTYHDIYPCVVECWQDVDIDTTDVYIPGHVKLVFPEGHSIISSSGAKIYCQSNTSVIGAYMDGAQLALKNNDGGSGTIVGNVQVIACSAKETSFGVLQANNVNGANSNQWITTAFCESIDSNYFHYQQKIAKSKFVFNKCSNSDSTRRGMQFNGGESSLIAYNYIENAVTGVNFLLTRSVTQGARYNRVYCNWGHKITEEFVSFDADGNTSADICLIDVCTVTGSTGSAGSNPSIQVARTATTNIATNGQIVAVVSGPHTGKFWPIVFSATVDASNIRLQLPNNQITATELSEIASGGGKVVIMYAAYHNLVDSNQCNEGFSPYVGYGVSIGNLWVNNIATNTTGDYSGRITSLAIDSNIMLSAPAGTGFTPSMGDAFVNNSFDKPIDSRVGSYNGNLTATYGPLPLYLSNNTVTVHHSKWTDGNNSNVYDQNAHTIDDGSLAGDLGFTTARTDYTQNPFLMMDFNTEPKVNGVATVSGTGSTPINIPHLLGFPPNKFEVHANNAAAASSDFYVTADANNLIVNYTGTNPTSGTNNLSYRFSAEIIRM